MSENEQAAEGKVEQLYAFVAGEMKSGADKASIAAKLQEKGMGRSDAEQLVDKTYREITEFVKQEQFTSGSLIPALAGGIIAAVVGGAVWGGVAMLTDYEVGFLAWGIGALCGFAVVMFTRGSKGLPLQIIAVACAVLGIVLGKYFVFYHFLKQMVAEEQGAEAVEQMSLLSIGVMQYFVQVLPSMLGIYDLLWFGLAVFTAWGIPRSSGIRLPQGSSGPIG